MNFRKEVFDDVSKFLYSDAQPVPGGFAAVPKRVAMQFTGFRPSLQSNALKRRAAETNAVGAAGKRLGPGLPLLSVEFPKNLPGMGFKRLLLALGVSQELLGDRIFCRP